MELVKVTDLTKEYQSDEVVTPVLAGLSFVIQAGEFVAITGPSGSGKSTLMHILGFLDRPSGGRYWYKGQPTADFNDDQLAEIRNKSVGFVFQSFFLMSKTTVMENVKLPLIYNNEPNKEAIAKQAVAAVGLTHRLNHFSSQLSGGEKQRVAMARAIVNNPDVIFADEPTGNLDSKSGQQIMEILEGLNKQGKTIILVTHEQDTANHAQRIIKLKDGQIVDDFLVQARRSVKDGDLVK